MSTRKTFCRHGLSLREALRPIRAVVSFAPGSGPSGRAMLANTGTNPVFEAHVRNTLGCQRRAAVLRYAWRPFIRREKTWTAALGESA